MCEYLGVTPKEFFDDGVREPLLVARVSAGIRDMDEKDLSALLVLIERLNNGK